LRPDAKLLLVHDAVKFLKQGDSDEKGASHSAPQIRECVKIQGDVPRGRSLTWFHGVPGGKSSRGAWTNCEAGRREREREEGGS
jgi:hypothetical protein